jgi:hypothetical protein
LIDGEVDAVDGLHLAEVADEFFGDDWCVGHPVSLSD